MKVIKYITITVAIGMLPPAAAAPPDFAAAAAAVEAMQNQDPDMISNDPFGLGLNKVEGFGPSEESVGDIDSFRDPVIYLGVQQTGVVLARPDCDSVPIDSETCITLPEEVSAVTSIDETDLAVFELPRNVSDSLICFTITSITNWSWANTTGALEIARMTVNPTLQIESDVLDDPNLIDANTGLPFNGELFPDGSISVPTTFKLRNLGPDDFELNAPRTTRACTNGLISKRSLELNHGLTARQARAFFRNPITIRFGVRGNISSVTSASFSYGIRLYGDR